jgi:hypothetical protein
MNTILQRAIRLTLAVLFSFSLAAAVFASTAPAEKLRQVGATAIVYRGPQVDMAMSYRYAKSNPKGGWLLVDTNMTAAQDPLEIPRGAFSIRTHSGEVIPLATQEEFGKDYAHLASTIARANVAAEPLGYLSFRRPEQMRFFVAPGQGIIYPSVWLDYRHNTYGRLFFQMPGGVQKGNYELILDLKGGQVVIPFTI